LRDRRVTTRDYTIRPIGEDAASFTIDYDQLLNEEQRAVVTAGDGKHLVLAGAGSGKTRALTFRVARMIERGVPAHQILLLTFTRRASAEMTGRIESLLQRDTRELWSGTFHAIGARILREFHAAIGYPANFSVIDAGDAETLVSQCIQDTPRGSSRSRFPKPKTLLIALSKAINGDRAVADIFFESYPQFVEHIDTIDECLLRYTARKRDLGVMDFDDLLVHWLHLLQQNDAARDTLQRRFRHILVDEYQDTNALQADIVDTLCGEHGNLVVVGDDCQAIYAFRGAHFANILSFEARHPAAKRALLERNYRSSPEILSLANASIRHNHEQFHKTLRATQPSGPKPARVECRDEKQQSQFVAQRILEIRDEGVPLNKIAVLYRAHWHSMELQIELARRGVPFEVRSGLRFFEQQHIKDIVAFMRFVCNPRDELAFARVMMLADGVGIATAQRLFTFVQAHDAPIDALRNPDFVRAAPRRAEAGTNTLRELLLDLHSPSMQDRAGEAIELIQSRWYDAYISRTFDNPSNRTLDLQTLSAYAEQLGSQSDLVNEIALATDISGVDAETNGEPDESAVLSTIHQAKGLEFHTVFLIWLSEDRFPSQRATSEQRDLEEERRLFYVAVTRAERELYLTSPMLAYERGRGQVVVRPSVFVSELMETHVNNLWDRWVLHAY